MKLFLDTNVLLDYYTRREPFFRHAKLLWTASFFGDVELWASMQSFTNAEHILRRAIPVQTLRAMMAASLERLHVATASPQDLADGMTLDWPDLEDFLIARSALNEGADYLITRDAEGFGASRVPALTPERFFTMMEKEHGVVYDEEGL